MKELGFSPKECYLMLTLINNALKTSENHLLDEMKYKILSSDIFEITETKKPVIEFEINF